jgi:hypothetical protein
MRLTCPPFGVGCWKLVATSLSIYKKTSLGGDPLLCVWLFEFLKNHWVPTFEIYFQIQRTIHGLRLFEKIISKSKEGPHFMLDKGSHTLYQSYVG